MSKNRDFKTKIDFEIFQYLKLSGIRGSEIYASNRFISPIFGTSVKDEAVAPFVNKNLGDKDKKYDVFRTNPKNSNDKYDEFKGQFANDFVRQEYFGRAENQKRKQVTDIDAKNNETMIAPITAAPAISSKVEENLPPINPIYQEDYETKPIRPDFLKRSQVSNENSKAFTPTFNATSAFEEFDDQINNKNVTVSQSSSPEKKVPKELEEKENRIKKYVLPSTEMFSKHKLNLTERSEWMNDQIDQINSTLEQFSIDGFVKNSVKGPTVTRYEIELAAGVNVKKVLSIQDNLLMNLEAKSLRIEAPIPGKPYVGIEVPNVVAELVAFGNVVSDPDFLASDKPLKIALGVDIDGKNIFADIEKMPHGLIAGATNSGKSVSVNTILASLLIKNTPDELKLILIDPKMVELTPFNDIPHLITPVITDPKLASSALTWAVDEMEKRYRIFAENRSRDIRAYNQNIFDGRIKNKIMPRVVIVIDELADLMMIAPHDVEDAIQRLTQKARAAGIHLLVATQRPTTDVIKGTIKSNIPTRIAFRVASFVDSITILDNAGAESLLGRGDMLLKEGDRLIRLQGAFIPDEEIYNLTDYIRGQQSPNYELLHEELTEKIQYREAVTDELFEDVAYFVVREQNASINSIQKEFSIGFNRAQSLVEMLQKFQIVSENQGTKAREVLVTTNELRILLNHDTE